jgi:hypothetical protein
MKSNINDKKLCPKLETFKFKKKIIIMMECFIFKIFVIGYDL